VPANITIVPLPAKCPELNPVENVWQFMRDNWLSNRVFGSYTAIVDHCCDAWNSGAGWGSRCRSHRSRGCWTERPDLPSSLHGSPIPWSPCQWGPLRHFRHLKLNARHGSTHGISEKPTMTVSSFARPSYSDPIPMRTIIRGGDLHGAARPAGAGGLVHLR
jgi:hypothetical protein